MAYKGLLIIKFIMMELPIDSIRLRPKSSLSRNCKNIELHACLDEAKLYRDRVAHHFSQSKFQNHTLQSVERVYEKGARVKAARSASAFRRTHSNLQNYSHEENASLYRSSSKLRKNPQQIFGVFEEKTLKITRIKHGFDNRVDEKQQLKQRMQELKRLIVIEKNKKAKISLNNSKLMNANVNSNHQIDNLMEQIRRNNILIEEVYGDVKQLMEENYELRNQNMRKEQQIRQVTEDNSRLQDYVNRTRRSLFDQRKNLQNLKQAQTISYKEMTNRYIVLNQRKQEKALLLNSIEIDVRNYS